MSRSQFSRSQLGNTTISRRGFAVGIAAATALATRARPARATGELQTTPGFFAVPITVAAALKSQSLIGDPWACSVSEAIAEEVGVGSQVRICRDSDHRAVFTITEIHSGDAADRVRMSKAARERLGLSESGFSATLRQALATAQMSDNQAKSAEEFIERIQDDKDHEGLLVMAPHGGAIEINTDRQARRVLQSLAGADVSSWCCTGYKQGGGAFDRWHVTSTLINPTSFPGLGLVTQRKFAYSVAFHGMGDAGVRIGGNGPTQLKQLLQQAIAAAIDDAAGPVVIAGKGDALGGVSAQNVTNWVTAGNAGGIQIEQSYTVRSKHWSDVADAVASVYAGVL